MELALQSFSFELSTNGWICVCFARQKQPLYISVNYGMTCVAKIKFRVCFLGVKEPNVTIRSFFWSIWWRFSGRLISWDCDFRVFSVRKISWFCAFSSVFHRVLFGEYYYICAENKIKKTGLPDPVLRRQRGRVVVVIYTGWLLGCWQILPVVPK